MLLSILKKEGKVLYIMTPPLFTKSKCPIELQSQQPPQIINLKFLSKVPSAPRKPVLRVIGD